MAVEFKLFHYNPSLAAAVVFVVLFILTSFAHIWQLIKKRTWYFIPFVIGGFFEWIGYIGRAAAAQQSPNWTVGPYICQSLLLLLAPALFAASIYMILGRIIVLTDGEIHSPIRARWLTKIFVTGDVVSFLAQSGGGGILSQAKNADDQKRGQNIIVGGLGIQILFFVFFMISCFIFHRRILRSPTQRSLSLTTSWKGYFFVLYTASALILIRNLYRVIEYAAGSDAIFMTNEGFLYGFDAALMFLLMVLFNVWHPGQVVSRQARSEAATAGLDLEARNQGGEEGRRVHGRARRHSRKRSDHK